MVKGVRSAGSPADDSAAHDERGPVVPDWRRLSLRSHIEESVDDLAGRPAAVAHHGIEEEPLGPHAILRLDAIGQPVREEHQ